ncbi:MAG: polynucleotide kinase-phosphatase, partial [Deltaproteobacteria bacterium]|nr:polynucleotide kinase-phosphatase [Deltaproteobacteria bacterium]
MKIIIPELSLVAIIGASGSGKSTFCKKHFKSTEILSSDYFRSLVSDDENDQTVTKEAFEALQFVMSKRLELGRITVCDATNVRAEDRKPLIEIARKYHCIPVAIVLNLHEKICQQRNNSRPDRNFGEHVIRNQIHKIKKSLRKLKWEGFRYIYVLHSPEEVEAVEIERQPLWNNKKHEHGPFDIIGDIHGCFDELTELLAEMGYLVQPRDGFPFGAGYEVTHPEGRKLVFLGDLVDRGPKIVQVLRLVMSMVHSDNARCVIGNHDAKLVKKLIGKNVQLKHGLAETMAQLEPETQEFKDYVKEFLSALVSHYVFDDGKLVVSHAGMREEYQGRGSSRVRNFALYGETTGETDEFGLPIRFNWAEEYRGKAMVVYGHTPVPDPEWLNRTINVDTGCVFGGKLSALRYPEKEVSSVPAHRVYAEPIRPLVPQPPNGLSLQHRSDDMLDIDDVFGRRFIRTSLRA